ncbi:hypothetical protein CRE_04370 [Caenorhabditis remanei]|uniref:F-box domain-containing protein n=1 Tax=Caenorhabditis remanei TaxID=31234 RepID=E3NIC8_CAERE|nr:hypothetical protein CRE_04370 [Caenorhabditis remanei]
MAPLPDSLKNDTHFLKSCILYEALHKKPVFESYRNFCEKIGDDVMSYYDFEYWYYRFYNGELDLEHDRSTDPPHHTFLQLPAEMHNMIWKNQNCKAKISMRRVCKRMKEVIGNQVVMFNNISVSLGANSLCVKLNDKKCVEYQKDTDNSCVICRPGQPDQKKSTGFLETALQDMSFSLRFLNIRAQHLTIDLEKDTPLDLLNTLAEYFPNPFFAVRVKIMIGKKTDSPKVLKLLELGYLEEIRIGHHSRGCASADSVHNLPQWKQATRADTVYFLKLDFNQLKHYYHLKHFVVELKNLSMEQAVILRDKLISLPQFESCEIYAPGFDAIFLRTAWALEENSGTYRYAIADSDKVLDFQFTEGHTFYISKKFE